MERPWGLFTMKKFCIGGGGEREGRLKSLLRSLVPTRATGGRLATWATHCAKEQSAELKSVEMSGAGNEELGVPAIRIALLSKGNWDALVPPVAEPLGTHERPRYPCLKGMGECWRLDVSHFKKTRRRR